MNGEKRGFGPGALAKAKAPVALRGLQAVLLAAVCAAVLWLAAPQQAWAYSAGETFTAPVDVIAADGSVSQTNCTFKKTNAFMVQVGDGMSKAVAASTQGTVVLPDTVDGAPVRTIAAYAFGSSTLAGACNRLTGVVIPSTVQTVGTYAFSYASQLQWLSRSADGAFEPALPEGVKTVGAYAFYYATALPSMALPSTLTTLGDYAFSRCTGLTSVEFAGDAPAVVGASVFAGGGVAIKSVIYRGTALPVTEALFNSETVAQPTFFYAVYFYQSREDYEAGRLEATALVREGLAIYQLSVPGAPDAFLAEGAVPAFPAGTNYWQVVEDRNEHETMTTSLHVYAVASDFNDLSASGSIDVRALSSVGALTSVSALAYTGYPVAFASFVRNGIGAELVPGKDYTLSYQRQNDQGVWTSTDDFQSLGTLRIIATAQGGLYHGVAVRDMEIDLEPGVVFRAPITGYLQGEKTQVMAHFSLQESPRPLETLAVAIEAPSDYEGSVDPAFEGVVVFPDDLRLGEYRLAVTRVATFGLRGSDCEAYVLPATLKTVDKWGIACLGSLVFMGDTSTVSFGTEAVLAAKRTVFFGDVPRLRDEIFGGMTSYYYGITYYESAEAYSEGAEPLGRLAIRDDVELMEVPSLAPEDEKLLASGAIDFPKWATGDGIWTGPYWAYPAVNEDAHAAMTQTLTAGTYAWADLTNDYLSVDWCHVKGVAEGQQFGCSGEDVLRDEDIVVYGHYGGLLRPGVDYAVSYERYDSADDIWVPSERAADFGEYHLVISGLAPHYGTYKLPFSITAVHSAPGTRFEALVSLAAEDGSTSEVPVSFMVSGGNTCKIARTAPWGTSGSEAALPSELVGSLEIPSRVQYLGWTYDVTGVEDRALASVCPLLDLTLPASLTSVTGGIGGTWRKVTVPLSLAEYNDITDRLTLGRTLTGATVGTLVIPEGIEALDYSAVSYCTLGALELPSSLKALSTSAFSMTTIEEFRYQASWPFEHMGGLQPKKLIVEEGVEAIPDGFARDAAATQVVELPSTLLSIGADAFRGTGVSEVVIPDRVATIGSYAFGNSKVTTVTLGKGIQSVGSYAFGVQGWGQVSVLKNVSFRGDPEEVAMDNAFEGADIIERVSFYEGSCANRASLFAGSKPTYFYGVTFYEDAAAYQAGDSCGFALVSGEVAYRDVSSATTGALVAEGSVPAFAAGCDGWQFAHGPHSNASIDRACAAWGIATDATDLSQASFSLEYSDDHTYAYTGFPVDVMASGLVTVRNVAGTRVPQAQLAWSFERCNPETGEWEPAGELVSPGVVRLRITPAAGSSYRGELVTWYTITRYPVGTTFAQEDAFGNRLVYRVMEAPSLAGAGAVALASCQDAAGTVAPPAMVADGDGLAYAVERIDAEAAYRCVAIEEFRIPASVKFVGGRAFGYAYEPGDVAESALRTVQFDGNVDDISLSGDAFAGCDELAHVVYGAKKGTFDAFGPNSDELTRWYTVTYYADKAAFEAGGEPWSKVVLQEGAYVDAPSLNAYWTGYSAADIPVLDDNHRWRYEEGPLTALRRIDDSLWAFGRLAEGATFTDQVELIKADGTSELVACLFRPLMDEDGELVGGAVVGAGDAARHAVDAATAGTLVIPEEVHDADGRAYAVAGVDAFAFGSDGIEPACTALTGIALPSGVATVGQGAFAGCSALSTVRWALNVEGGCSLRTVGASAFADCSSLSAIELPEGVTSLGASAFARSGLAQVRLPFTLTTLGRSAFAQCAALREAVFAGSLPLELPAVEGAQVGIPAESLGLEPALGVDETGAPTATLPLALVDDYAFAQCPSLARVVFEGDAAATELSPQAFEGDGALETVVFGGAMASGADEAFDERAAYWVTVSYYASMEHREALDRLGYAVVAPEAVFDTLEDDDLYAGARCEALPDWEWAGAFDTAAALENSQAVWMTRSLFAVTLDDEEGAFALTCRVSDAEAQKAAAGAAVTVTAVPQGTWQPARLVVREKESGAVVAETPGAALTFAMPACAVEVSVEGSFALPVYRQPLKGEPVLAATLTSDEVAALASSEEVSYSAFDTAFDVRTVDTAWAAPLEAVLQAADITLEGGESLVVETAAGKRVTLSLDAVRAKRYFYPFAADRNQSGAREVPAVLALSLSEDGAPTSRAAALRLLYGQTAEEMTMQRATFGNFAAGVTALTVVEGFSDLSQGSLGGLEARYPWTGDAVAPAPVVTDRTGDELVAGRDYRLDWSDNREAGWATVTATGEGVYQGELSASFRIARAFEVAGAGAAGTVAQAALEAYPAGAPGAVVVPAAHVTDALGAAVLANKAGWPALLVSQDAVPAATEDALAALARGNNAFRVVMLGSTSWASDAVKQKLGEVVGRAQNVTRLAASNASALSALVGEYGEGQGLWGAGEYAALSAPLSQGVAGLAALGASDAPATVYLSSAGAPAEALAATVAAGAAGGRVVLLEGDNAAALARLSAWEPTLCRLGFVGDGTVVSAAVRQQALSALVWPAAAFPEALEAPVRPALSEVTLTPQPTTPAAGGAVAPSAPSTSGTASGGSAASAAPAAPVAKATPKLAFKAAKLAKTYGAKAFSCALKTKVTDGKITYRSSKPSVAKVSAAGKVTIKGVGVATITAKSAATARYKAGSAKVVLTVKPAKQKIAKLKTAKGALTVSWKKSAKATGYQIQLSTSKKFTKKTTVTKKVTKKSVGSQKVTKLKSKKKYYVRVRTYTVTGGKTYYGAWSTVKSAKVK